jgi:hypothetical protein
MQTKAIRYPTCVTLIVALVSSLQDSGAATSPMIITHEFDAKWGYVADTIVEGPGPSFDSGGEQSSHLRYVLSPQITSRVLLHFGAEWQRFSFSPPRLAPVPDTLQGVNAILGADWQFSDRWLFRADLRPGVYSTFRDVSWTHVDAPVFLGGVYLVNPNLQWFFGVRVDLRSEYPVIPGIGVRWKFADEWTLSAVLPTPRLEYAIDSRFKAHFGADLKTGSFRVGDTFGSDRGWPGLDRQILDYFEVSVGPGISWKIRPNISVEANAGFMVFRRFDFAHRDIAFRSDPAPRFQIAFNVGL